MKTLMIGMVWLAAVISAAAQGPRMTDLRTGELLEIDQVVVTVRLVGGVAETVMELRFRNESRRMVEGEFVLPLPAGATVSSYALEVNGALREAVAVEKERARHAYESIKRQMIDPGLVEREAGNIYRTRVFPVPAQGTKLLRIGYVEFLKEDDGHYQYHLPLSFPLPLKSFRCEIHGAGEIAPVLLGDAPLRFAAAADGSRIAQHEAITLNGSLNLSVPLPTGSHVIVEDAADPVFLFTSRVPEIEKAPRRAPRKLRLYWQASESAAAADHAPTFALLDAWFAELGDLEVELVFLRDQPENGGIHVVRGGGWAELRKALEAVGYYGASSLAPITDADGWPDSLLYCGDGAPTLGQELGLVTCPLVFFRHGGKPAAASLLEAVMRSGGARVDVESMDLAAALRELSMESIRVLEVSGTNMTDYQLPPAVLVPGAPLHFTGRLNSGEAGVIEITYAIGPERRIRRSVFQPAAGESTGLIRRLWAQRALAEMEASPLPDRRAIIEHCKRHSLVSDETSLIVLERFQDHITYEIPPPEPEWLVKYEQGLAEKRTVAVDPLSAAWRNRVAWHARYFPGEEYPLMPRLRQVSIWKQAVNRSFAPADLDREAFGVISGWRERVLALVERRRHLENSAEHEAWLAEVKQLEQEGTKLAATPVAPPAQGEELVVSVRGMVADPGVVRSRAGLTLTEAVREAGGVLGTSGEAIAIYRNAGKAVYNPKSRRYEDISLMRGDMVVVESPWRGAQLDPFASESPSRLATRPVLLEKDVWVSGRSSPDGGDGDTLGGGTGGQAVAGVIRLVDSATAEMPGLEEFKRRLAAGDDAKMAFLELLDSERYPTEFYIGVARILFDHGEESLAHTVLSTLVERGGGSVHSRLAHAFWLVEFGQHSAAESSLAEIPRMDGGAPRAWLHAELAEDASVAVDRLAHLLDRQQPLVTRLFALTEINQRVPEPDRSPAGPELFHHLDADIRITLTGEFPDAPINVRIIDPIGEVLGHGRIGNTGGLLSRGDGVSEFMIRRALPGTYTVVCESAVDVSVRLAIHTEWGRENQTTLRGSRFVPAGETVTLGTLDFAFPPP